jgi:hypothetical protein
MRKLAMIIITFAFGLAPIGCDEKADKKDEKKADDKKDEKKDEKKDGGW